MLCKSSFYVVILGRDCCSCRVMADNNNNLDYLMEKPGVEKRKKLKRTVDKTVPYASVFLMVCLVMLQFVNYPTMKREKMCPISELKLRMEDANGSTFLYPDYHVKFNGKEQKLVIGSYTEEETEKLELNHTVLRKLHSWFDVCFGKSTQCKIPEEFLDQTKRGLGVLCTYRLDLQRVLTICFDYNRRLSGGFSGRYIFYPEFLKDISLLLNRIGLV